MVDETPRRHYPEIVRQEGSFGHVFRRTHFATPTFCKLCSGFIWGIGMQGYQCQACKYSVHKKCVFDSPNTCFEAVDTSREDALAEVATPAPPAPVPAATMDIKGKAALEGISASANANPVSLAATVFMQVSATAQAVAPATRLRSSPASSTPSLPEAPHAKPEPKAPLLMMRFGAGSKGSDSDIETPAEPVRSKFSPRPASPGLSPRAPSPESADDLSLLLENISLESSRLRLKNESTQFLSGHVAQLAADRRELERTVEALLAKKDVLRTQIAELEAAVAALHMNVKDSSGRVLNLASTVAASLTACTQRFGEILAAAERDPNVTRKHYASMQTVGLKLEELLGCEQILFEHNEHLRFVQKKLTLYTDMLEKRLKEMTIVEAELRRELTDLGKDGIQLSAMGTSLQQLQEELSRVQPTDFPKKELQGVLHDLNTQLKALSAQPKKGGSELWTLQSGSGDQVDTESIRYGPKLPNGLRVIKAATADKLVELLTPDSYSDVDFQKKFLIAYRSFMTPKQLLEKLLIRYCVTPPPRSEELLSQRHSKQLPIRSRVLNVLRLWVEEHAEDWLDGEMCRMATSFIEHTVKPSGGNRSIADGFLTVLHRKCVIRAHFSAQRSSSIQAQKFPSNPPPSIQPPPGFSILDVDALEMARQITIGDSSLFRAIQVGEFMNLAWLRESKEVKAPNITAFLIRYAKISYWTISEILRYSDLPTRQQTLKKFISVAHECRQLNNFNGCLAILEGLENPSIWRLRQTWEGVDMEMYKQLKELLQDNHRKLAQLLRTASPPCVPYLGVFLSEIQQIEDGTPDIVGGSLINWYKRDTMAAVILDIRRLQEASYNLRKVPELQDYLDKFKIMSAPEAEARAHELERTFTRLRI